MSRTNPLIWGAVAAIVGAGIVIVARLTGDPTPSNELLQSPFSAAAVSFFWGWAAGNAKNWYGNKINRR